NPQQSRIINEKRGTTFSCPGPLGSNHINGLHAAPMLKLSKISLGSTFRTPMPRGWARHSRVFARFLILGPSCQMRRRALPQTNSPLTFCRHGRRRSSSTSSRTPTTSCRPRWRHSCPIWLRVEQGALPCISSRSFPYRLFDRPQALPKFNRFQRLTPYLEDGGHSHSLVRRQVTRRHRDRQRRHRRRTRAAPF